MTNDDLAIETRGLRKVYGSKIAVNGLTLEVRRGEAFGFLGPNGAGKTTSIKMLLGLAEPTSGSGRLLGSPLRHPSIRSKVGFLPEHFRFHEWLTGYEFLRLHGRLYRMQADHLQHRIRELLALVGLTEFFGQQLRTYSKGMLQRIGLAQALLNDPEIVFLDEPTSGLDPAGRRLVRDIITELRKKGTTVFLNSHFLSEVEVTCDRVAFIKHGEVLRVEELGKLAAGHVVVNIKADGITPEIIEGLKQWASEIFSDGNRIRLKIADESSLPPLNRYLVAKNVAVYSIEPEKVTLEDLFLKIVGKDAGL
jgi:ABC-2 type transport system ATP-binding protein